MSTRENEWRSTARWSQIHLVMTRGRTGSSEVTLSHRTGTGTLRWDRRLRWGRIETAPGSPASADLIVALVHGLESVLTLEELLLAVRTLDELAQRASPPPGGPRGEPTP